MWIKDLTQYLKNKIKAYINKLPNDLKNNGVIILGKSDVKKCKIIKKNSK